MDKPQIDFEKLKEFQDKKKEAEQPPTVKPHPSLTDPYYPWRKQLINIDDFDEWDNN